MGQINPDRSPCFNLKWCGGSKVAFFYWITGFRVTEYTVQNICFLANTPQRHWKKTCIFNFGWSLIQNACSMSSSRATGQTLAGACLHCSIVKAAQALPYSPLGQPAWRPLTPTFRYQVSSIILQGCNLQLVLGPCANCQLWRWHPVFWFDLMSLGIKTVVAFRAGLC